MESLGVILLIALPALAGLGIWLLPENRGGLIRAISLLVGLATLVISFALWLELPRVRPGEMVGESNLSWVAAGETNAEGDPTSGIVVRFHVGLDSISAQLALLTGILLPLSIACGFTAIRKRVREYYAWMLLLGAGVFGVFAARDVLLFYICFEFTLVPLYFLIGIWGGPERRHAANTFFLYTFTGSMISFGGILYLALRASAGSGLVDFDLVKLSTVTDLTFVEQSWLFLAFFAGFAIKVPFFPLHTWLPLAHTEAPTAGSVLLAGVLLKLGTYGFLRFSLPMVPQGAVHWAGLMGLLATIGIVYTALCSWLQTDAKRLVAYSSVSHLGFCMLGMFSFLPIGLTGAVLYMVNHGLSTGALFLCIGMLYERYHTHDMNKFGGLMSKMPILSAFLIFFAFTSVGVPGLNGFVSEFMTLIAAYNSPRLYESAGVWFGVIGASGIVLGAVYLFYMTGRVLFGPVKEPPHTPDLSGGLRPDLNAREIAILTPLALLCIVLGVAPRLITDTLDPSLDRILARVKPYLPQPADLGSKTVAAATISPDRAAVPFGESAE